MSAVAAAKRAASPTTELTLGLAIGLGTLAVAWAQGGYGIGSWGPLGLVLLFGVFLQAAAGHAPGRQALVTAGMLVGLGAWTAASAGWGGVPESAWGAFDRTVLTAAALLVGASLGRREHRARVVAAAVGAGIAAVAVGELGLLGVYPGRGGWLVAGVLQGPVGYKNAQGGLFALGLPLALWLTADRRPAVRSVAAASGVVLVAALLLTESRGAVAAAALALLLQSVVDRRPVVRIGALALATIGIVLLAALLLLHARLVDPGQAAGALRVYLGVVAAFAVVVVLAVRRRAAPRTRDIGRRRTLLAGLAVAAVGTTVLVLAASHASARTGGPQLTGLTLSGRLELWHAAWQMWLGNPLIGHGAGSFARTWPSLRGASTLSVLQPHSIELEQLAELGAVGLALLVGAVLLAARSLRRPRNRPLAAAAIGMLAALVLQASIDWTWNFPALLVPVFLVVGAACSRDVDASAPDRPRLALLLGCCALAASLAVAAPYLAHLETSAVTAATTPERSLSAAASALRVYPWAADAYVLRGHALELTGAFAAAADAYARAADLSLHPWVRHLDEARADREAKLPRVALAACQDALLENPSVADAVRALCPQPEGRAWPLAAQAEAPPQPWARLLVSDGCGGCSVHPRAAGLRARVGGGIDPVDSAFGVAELPTSPGRPTTISFKVALQRQPRGPATILEVRDARARLIYALVIDGDSRELLFYNPPGGMYRASFVAPLHVLVPLGAPALRVTVSTLAGAFVHVAAAGSERLRMPGPGWALPTGATTGPPRHAEIGVISYDTKAADDPFGVDVSGLMLDQSAS